MQSDTLQKISEEENQSLAKESQLLPENEKTGAASSFEQKNDSEKEVISRKSRIRNVLWFLCGILWGITLMFIAGVFYLRHNLIQEIPLEDDFAQAADKIGPVAQKYGWQVSYNQCGLPRLINDQPIEVYRLCKSQYAYELLLDENERKISCMLPCAISIYRKSDGVTYISRLNMPLFTQLLGGSSIEVFQQKISPEQRAIISHFPEKNTVAE